MFPVPIQKSGIDLLSLNSSKNTFNALVWNGDRRTTENFRLIGSCFMFITFKEPIEHSLRIAQ